MKTEGEEIIIEKLRRHGLRAERFTNAEMKASQTPDFRVFKGDVLAFHCEVKDVMDASPLWLPGREVNSGVFKQGKQGYLGQLPIADKIEQAIAQFCAVDPFHDQLRILAFVNQHDRVYGEVLHELLTKTASEHGEWTDNTVRARIHSIKMEIDAYLWNDFHDFPSENRMILMHDKGSERALQIDALIPSSD